MYFLNVESIRLINIRNYRNINLSFNKNINIFIGKNGQGKTNLLEAIYMCSNGRSFRTNRDSDIINFAKNEAYIGADIRTENFNKLIELKLDRNKPKRIRINRTELKSQRELDSGLYVVLFFPDHIRIVKDGPQERRNFIDDVISQLRPVYKYNLNRYRKILLQRNNLLKSSKFNRDSGNLLDLFDLQIAKIGTSIILERHKYIKRLEKIANHIHSTITKNVENLTLHYSSNIPITKDRQEMEEAYINLLRKKINKDLEFGTTEIGPHRDDILMFLNDKDARIFGSQGQQRSLVLSLILSEVELIKEEIGLYPVVLLDDVLSELDEDRREYLIRYLENMQVFITMTEMENLQTLDNLDKTIFHINDGKLEMESC